MTGISLSCITPVRTEDGSSALGRVYGGRSNAERDAQRRACVLDAGLQLFGTKGFQPTSMTEIAELAQVAFRYVARLFPDKEALLAAVFVGIQDRVLSAIVETRQEAGPDLAQQIRSGLRAAVTAYAHDARQVRVSCLEVVGVSRRLEELRHGAHRRFVDQLVQGLNSAVQAGETLPPGYALLGVGLVGAVEALLADWALSPPATQVRLDDVIEAATLIYLRSLGLADRA